jgi:hypothetical protein
MDRICTTQDDKRYICIFFKSCLESLTLNSIDHKITIKTMIKMDLAHSDLSDYI